MECREREQAALLTLLRQSRGTTGWNQVAAEVAYEGSAVSVLESESDDALFADPETHSSVAEAAEDIRRWHDAGLKFVTLLDTEYPVRLREIHETPPFLFYRGQLRADDPGMSVVGSRAASPWGLTFADQAARLLADRGHTVVSGLAAGIDTSAHRAALDAGGRTVAFIGTGITRTYPAENAALQEEIAERGLVLSQFYPDAPPTKHSFPIRNTAMSGYGLASIIVEASEHSGARIQARVAGQHGRPVILTNRVVDATTWAKPLADSRGVHVVSSIDELAGVIDALSSRAERVESALRTMDGA